MVRKTQEVTAAWLLSRIDNDVIDLPSRPKATSSVIPFAKPKGKGDKDFIGKKVHALFDIEDDETGKNVCAFYKGEIVDGLKGGKFKVEFHDGDELEVDFCDKDETILWETGDITQGGRWMTEQDVQQGEDEELDIEGSIADAVKSPDRQRGKAKAWWTDGTGAKPDKAGASTAHDVKQAIEKVEKVEQMEEAERLERAEKPSTIEAKKGATKSENVEDTEDAENKEAPNAMEIGKEVTNAGTSQAERQPKRQGTSKTPAAVHQTEKKKQAPFPARDAPRPKVDDTNELRASIQAAGKEYLNALRSLQAAATHLSSLNTSLKTFALKGDVSADQLTSVAKGARGLVNHLLRPKAEFRNANDMGLEKVWPVNDLVMKPVSQLFSTTSSLCQKAKLPPATDGGVLELWRKAMAAPGEQGTRQPANENQPRREQSNNDDPTTHKKTETGEKKEIATPTRNKKRERDGHPLGSGELTPSASGELGPSPSREFTPSRPPKQAKRLDSIFPSTGSKVRDDALKILAHSLISSAATPYELAVDIEAAVHNKFPATDKGTFPDEYYRSILGARDVLNVDSDQCRQIVRLMVLEGFLSPDDFVSNNAEELEAQLAAFRKKLMDT